MYNAQQGINWHEILRQVNSDPELNSQNVINKIAEAILKAHPNINFNLNNVALLHIAINYNTKNAAEEKNRVDTINIVKALLETGINVKAKDPTDDETFLLRATKRKEIDIEVIKAIINAGAEVNAAYCVSKVTSLHNAASNDRSDIVKTLLETGANPNAIDVFQDTALHVASLHGYAEVIFHLLTAGAKVNAKDNQGETPLHNAATFISLNPKKAQKGQKVIKILLMYDADILSKNGWDKTPMDVTRKDDIKLFIEKAFNEVRSMKGEEIDTIVDYLLPEIAKYLTDTSVEKIAKKALTTTKH